MQSARPESHPDADLLTAFVEHSLTTREQEQVLGHLATCANCREVVALAGSPLVEPVPEPVRKRGLWEMPLFRWGAVAATTVVVVAAVSLGVRERKTAPAARAIMEERLPQAAESVEADKVASEPQVASPKAKAVHPTLDQRLSSSVNSPAKGEVAGTRRAPHLQEQVRYERPQTAVLAKAGTSTETAAGRIDQSGAGASGASAGNSASLDASKAFTVDTRDQNLPMIQGRSYAQSVTVQTVPVQPAKDEKAETKQAPAATGGPSAQQNAAGNYSLNAYQANETVIVTQETEVVQMNAAPVPQAPPPTAAQEAQPAKDSMMPKKQFDSTRMKSAYGYLHPVSPIKSVATGTEWQITREGILQRSFNWGAHWENVLADHIFRSVAVVIDHVWAGGDKGVLYFSSDNGRNWKPIPVHDGNASITGGIVRLRFIDEQNGSLDTSTGETWNTNDGGQSWHKQQ